jgi:hypothetical protein
MFMMLAIVYVQYPLEFEAKFQISDVGGIYLSMNLIIIWVEDV